jgi:amino acid permease
MVGSAMVSLPWSFQNSGIMLGLIVSFTSFVISFYTCSLIIKTTKKDSDYIFTLKKYYGNTGYYIGIIGPTILIFGAITVYFVVIVQSMYPLILALCNKGFKMNLAYINPN